jgi:rhamnogalacturonyl hydrolase YesR
MLGFVQSSSKCSGNARRSSSFVVSALLLLLNTQTFSQTSSETRRVLNVVANGIIKDATFQFVNTKTGERLSTTSNARADAQLKLQSGYNDWRYWNGVLNIAMKRLGEALHDTTYALFPERNAAFCFDNGPYFKEHNKEEGKWNYPFGQFFRMEELDDCGAMGASVIETYRGDPQERYRKYIDLAANHITKIQARMDDGTLVRSFPRKWTLWVDDLYMSISFLSRIGDLSGDVRYFDDAVRQVVNFHRYLFDSEKRLLRHCWFSDTRSPGVAFWGRGNGWAMLAQVDLLDRLPANHPSRDTLLVLLKRDIDGIAQYQSSDGLWHQLLDMPDSYEETSCSAMFTYAIARGINKGYIAASYAPVARRGWEGVASRIRSDGQIEGVCAGTGVGDNLDFYYKRPTPLNDPHGIGAVLLAAVEVMNLR